MKEDTLHDGNIMIIDKKERCLEIKISEILDELKKIVEFGIGGESFEITKQLVKDKTHGRFPNIFDLCSVV